MKFARLSIAALLLASSAAALAQPAPLAPDQVFIAKASDGVAVTPLTGPEVRLQVYGDRIIQVTRSPTRNLSLPPSFTVTARPGSVPFTIVDSPGQVTVATQIRSSDRRILPTARSPSPTRRAKSISRRALPEPSRR